MIVSTSWGVLVVQQQRHKLLAEALTSRGVGYFIPVVEELTISRGRHERAYKPLLGEYVLFAVSSIWKTLLSIRGVSGMLLNEAGYPAQVLPRELERLRLMCDGDILRPIVSKVVGELEYGDRVKATSGPFQNHFGKYYGKTKRGDAALFLLFGREQRVEFKRGDLIAV